VEETLKSSWLINGMTAVWLVLSVSGICAFWNYTFVSAELSHTQNMLPSETDLSPDFEHSLLLVFVHPKCACTIATLEELKTLWSRLSQRRVAPMPALTFVVRTPEELSGWDETPIVRMCREFAGGHVYFDANGVETRRFGITTSGTLALYGSHENLLYIGGITQSRGHRGPSAGSEQLFRALETGRACTSNVPVFGCLMFSGSDERNSAGLVERRSQGFETKSFSTEVH